MPKTKKTRGVKELQKVLESLDADIEEKKHTLTSLAHLGTKEANEIIANFAFSLNETDVDELRQWTDLALEEGEYLASVPKNKAEEEKMLKESVHQEYMDRFFELSAKIEEIEEGIKRRRYEYEVVKRLKKKAKTKEEKDDWNIEEMAQHDILVWEEGRKQKLEEELKTVAAIVAEMNAEIEALA